MKRYFITFRSVTFAQRGERVLRSSGVRCAIQRTPKWMEEQGCGYSLGLYTEDIAGVIAQLRRTRIPMKKVYLQKQEGQLEEVAV